MYILRISKLDLYTAKIYTIFQSYLEVVIYKFD